MGKARGRDNDDVNVREKGLLRIVATTFGKFSRSKEKESCKCKLRVGFEDVRCLFGHSENGGSRMSSEVEWED